MKIHVIFFILNYGDSRMNIQDTLKYAKVDERFSSSMWYGLRDFLEGLGVTISVDQELYEQNNSDMSLELHNVHEFSVDHHFGRKQIGPKE